MYGVKSCGVQLFCRRWSSGRRLDPYRGSPSIILTGSFFVYRSDHLDIQLRGPLYTEFLIWDCSTPPSLQINHWIRICLLVFRLFSFMSQLINHFHPTTLQFVLPAYLVTAFLRRQYFQSDHVKFLAFIIFIQHGFSMYGYISITCSRLFNDRYYNATYK